MGKDVVETEGVVVECLPSTTFRVKLMGEGFEEHEIMATLSGKMRKNYIKILPGDTVKIEMTPYDLEKGRITYRERGGR